MTTSHDQNEPTSLKEVDWSAMKLLLIHELHQTPEQAQMIMDRYASRIVIRQLIASYRKNMPLLSGDERNEFRRELLKAFKTIMDESPRGVDRTAGMEFATLMQEDIQVLKREMEEMDAALVGDGSDLVAS